MGDSVKKQKHSEMMPKRVGFQGLPEGDPDDEDDRKRPLPLRCPALFDGEIRRQNQTVRFNAFHTRAFF